MEKCIESIINQTYKNLEIIIVDDGSPDNCPKICDEYAQKDNRIKVIHKENGGLSDARNAGIDVATGKYIAFVDSDDYVSNDYIEYMYNLIKKYNTQMATCETEVINAEKNKVIKPSESEENIEVFSKRDLFYNILFAKKVEINAQNQGTKLSFKDVPENEWYYSAVKYVYEKKIILGYNTTTFAPNDKITRGMLVTILYRMEGSPKVTIVSKFSDVQNTKEYYYKAVNLAAANNIVSGYSDPKNKGKFGPDDKITREQLAVILWKYSRYKGKYKAVKTDFSKFSDSAKISEYAKNGMNWVLGVGVMHGSGGKLNPQGTATRAEAAAMLSNYCKNVK